MKILVVGGTGIIGTAVVKMLKEANHEVISTGFNNGDYQVNIEDKSAIEKMFEDIKDIDGIISTTGMASPAPLNHISDSDIDLALNNKLKGQVNLIREGLKTCKRRWFYYSYYRCS